MIILGKNITSFRKKGLHPKAIINTHSHADHCGGNAYFKEKKNVTIYASEIESGIIQYPILEPLYFFSGASPIRDLENKFLMAKPSHVDYIIKNGEERLFIDGIELGIISLPGHSPNQIGIEVEDILFCADSVFSKYALRTHKIPFYIDIDKQKETLNFLKNSKYKLYIPSHAEPTENIMDLVEANMEIIEDVEQYLLENINDSKTTEQILKNLCDHYNIEIKTGQEYYLMNTVTMAYLSSLYKRGNLNYVIRENSLFWEK